MAVLNKNGITSGSVILPAHVTQIVDALTASGSYTIAITGALGIGTTSPDTPLMVVGQTSFGKAGVSSQSSIQMWPDAAGASAFYIKNDGGLKVGTGANPYSGGNDFFSFDGSGNATLIGNSTIVGNSVVSGSTTLFNNAGALNLKGVNEVYTQWYPDGSTRRAYFGFPSSGSKNIILENEWSTGNISLITNNGFIGINNYTPQASLDVTGTVKITGNTSITGITSLTGSMAVTGSTTINDGNLSIVNSYPRLFLTDTDSDSDYSLINDNGNFTIYDDTNTAPRIYILPGGNVGINKFAPNSTFDVNGNALVTGSITATSTISSTNFSSSGVVTIGTPGVNNSSHIQFWPNDASGNAYYIEDYNSIFSIGSGVYGSGTSVLSISGSNIGIGKTTPNAKLDVDGNIIITGSLTITDTTNTLSLPSTSIISKAIGLDIVTTSTEVNAPITLKANNSGGVRLTNGATSWVAVSDERAKNIIEPITGSLNKVKTLRTVIGKYKNDKIGTRRVFLIAQDVQKVLPEAVYVDNDKEKTLSLAYTEIIPLLVSAIKEQQTQVEILQQQINTLLSGSNQ